MAAPPVRPMLSPAVRTLWRDAATVQVGLDPGSAVVLSGLPPGAGELLRLLDGRRTEAEVLAAAPPLGISVADAAGVLALLRRNGLLLEGDPLADLPPELAPATRQRLGPELAGARLTSGGGETLRPGAAIAARTRARVVVRGGGRTAVPLGALLAAAGVGHVHVSVEGTVGTAEVAAGGYRAEDVRRPRSTAAAEAIRAVAPETDTRPVPVGEVPHVVVYSRCDQPSIVAALTPEARHVPHLALDVRGDLAIVGPLVVPGRTACLHCVYLHRCDRDAGWPALAAQLAAEAADAQCSAAVAAFAAGVAALQILTHLDGGAPDALSASLELGSPAALVRRRSWAPHPCCGCLRATLADVG